MKFATVIEYTTDKAKIAEVRPVHRKYLDSLKAANKLALSGPFAHDGGALIVYEADSQEEAENLLRNDPFAQAGVFVKWEMNPWSLLFVNRALLPE
jgi:uncharacterized protein YciI